MFYALKFGEKPPNGSVLPMRARGEDPRTHIYSQTAPGKNENVAKMYATSSWAAHADPTALPQPAEGTPRVHTSLLLQKRERGRELATKPQEVKQQAEVAAPVYAKPAVSREAPFAVDAHAPSIPRASQTYGAFAAPSPHQRAPTAANAQPPVTHARIHDTVPAHQVLQAEPSQVVVGTFSGGAGAGRNAAAGGPNKIDASTPEGVQAMIEEAVQPTPGPIVVDRTTRAEESRGNAAVTSGRYALPAAPGAPLPKASGAASNPAARILNPSQEQLPPKPTNVVPQPNLPRTALSSGALQALGNWKYQHTPHPVRYSEREEKGGTASTAPSESVVAPSAAGPQVDWWVKQQRRYEGDRRDEGTAAMKAMLATTTDPKDAPGGLSAPQPTIATTATAAAVPPPPPAHPTPAPGPFGTKLAPGTQLIVQADGSIRVVAPDPVSQQRDAPKIQNRAAVLEPKNQGLTRGTEANIPPPPDRPGGSAAIRLTSALPIAVTNALRTAAPVVQSVGGPPLTSIGRRTHDAIRDERNAQAKARWLAEAPARAEALQRKVDGIVKSLKQSVEAKGFSEPTKGAQYIVKVCRQQTSTPREEMDFAAFCNVLQKGFAVSLPDDEADALFARLDLDETTVVPFRVFAETVFGILRHKGQSMESRHAQMNPMTRKLLEDVKTKIARRHGGESWLLAFQKAFKTLNRVADGPRGNVGAGGTGSLTAKELHASLTHLGITPLTLHDANNLVLAMDTDKSGTVDEDELLYAMRGPVSRKRRALIFQAFNILDQDKSGHVTLDEIADRYNAAEHPRVLAGEATTEEVLREFIALWNRDADAVITWQEFLDYYKTLSASIENDDYFELMIRNCWHMSGGVGVAENTTCRRVLVTYHDKTQKVVELQNDLGIGPKDLDKMLAQLSKQGERNVETIALYG